MDILLILSIVLGAGIGYNLGYYTWEKHEEWAYRARIRKWRKEGYDI